MLNISDPYNPFIIGNYVNGVESVVGITKFENYLFLSAHEDGLIILEIEDSPKIDSFSITFLIFSSGIAVTAIIFKLFSIKRQEDQK